MITPRIEIDLAKIGHNVRILVGRFASMNIQLIGVNKVVCGNPDIAQVLNKNGIKIVKT